MSDLFLVRVKCFFQIHTAPVQNVMAAQKLDMASYLRHYTPALEWILSCLAHKAREVCTIHLYNGCVCVCVIVTALHVCYLNVKFYQVKLLL